MTPARLFPRRTALRYMAGTCLWIPSAHAQGATKRPWHVLQLKDEPSPGGRAGPAAEADAAGRLLNWPVTVLDLVVKYQQNPLRAARALAYVQVAVHDAWLHASQAWPGAASVELASHRAASLVAEQLYPHEIPGQFEAQFARLRAQLALPDPVARAAERLGSDVATTLVHRSLRDGAGRTWSPRTRPAPFPGRWEPTFPLYAATPAEGLAGQWRCWLPASAARYDPPPPARPGSAIHAQETQEVLDVARRLDDARRQAAQDWHLDAGSVTPAGVWMRHTLALLAQAPAELNAAQAMARVARVGSAVAVAMADAFVDCWRVKLRDWSERPITAVRRELDAGFTPLLVTPGFPSYVSGHATVSAAAATVLAHCFPERAAALMAMAEEAAMSRLWGGLHFRSDNDEGLRLGRSIGGEVVDRLAS